MLYISCGFLWPGNRQTDFSIPTDVYFVGLFVCVILCCGFVIYLGWEGFFFFLGGGNFLLSQLGSPPLPHPHTHRDLKFGSVFLRKGSCDRLELSSLITGFKPAPAVLERKTTISNTEIGNDDRHVRKAGAFVSLFDCVVG